MIIGSGPIVIGQAAEFDYSGSQALVALKEEGHEVVLVNNNPATIMTDLGFADRTYLEPLAVDVVEEIIRVERPDGLLATLGGQTGLNIAVALGERGVYEKYKVELLGTPLASIRQAEDRGAFKALLKEMGEPVLESDLVRTVEEARRCAQEIGFPLVIRPAYTLGGSGGGFAENASQLEERVALGLERSPVTEVLLEKSIVGWRELEYEVMRDRAGNAVTICNMENLDPMGVHTGDSVVVAPSQTLTDREYQTLRTASLRIIGALGIEGGCNIQFALDYSGDYRVIEVNPRVSRSSALASKATGYPIARVAALIALGKTLPEIENRVTGTTSACFEPTLDYIVTKIPRWPFDKFPTADRRLGVQMKATGEVMAIGRTLKESLAKALRSLELPGNSLFPLAEKRDEELEVLMEKATDQRLFGVLEGLERGWGVERVSTLSGWDPFFVGEWLGMVDEMGAGRLGSKDQQKEVSTRRGLSLPKKIENRGVFRMVDTCASEFESRTAYLYGTEETEEDESELSGQAPVVVVGGGPIRIGQGIEFDCCCVHALTALREKGIPAVMVNNNPETVSTDFDMSDQLFFEPLTSEDVLRVVRRTKARGVILQFGGQTSLNLANDLTRVGVEILGTPLEGIEAAEDRGKIDAILGRLGIARPRGHALTHPDELDELLGALRLPVLVRPSFVLGGRAMRIAHSKEDLRAFVQLAYEQVDGEHPILVDEYVRGKEIEVDLVCDGESVHIPGVMEHIERAGVHSGDSMAVFPSYSLSDKEIESVVDVATRIAFALDTLGMLNIQFILSEGKLYVLEVNPRASRTVPFLAKATGISMAKVATRVMTGGSLIEEGIPLGLAPAPPMIALKAPVFSFAKLAGVRVDLGPEMKSTGEIMSFGEGLAEVFSKTWVSLGMDDIKPEKGAVLLTVNDDDKAYTVDLAKRFYALGYALCATSGTAKAIQAEGVVVEEVAKIGAQRNLLNDIQEGSIALVVNSVSGSGATQTDGRRIRQACVEIGVGLFTNVEAAEAFVETMERWEKGEGAGPVRALQDILAS
ncbi:carbamoyl-phosphate synthase large subunit [bacterium]|nr:carbamoyl-phosphate synthase large subunit [bacterium]